MRPATLAEVRPCVFVVGGAGYVGSHCCKALAAAGYLPVSFDSLATGHRDLVRWGPLVEGDVRDAAALREALAAHRPVAVMHFAALALVAESVAKPALYREVNVTGSRNLLQAMRQAGVDKLVFSSTCAIYGEAGDRPISEDVAFRPINPYGATKLEAERLMDGFDREHGLHSVRLRYFNACGADPEAETGEHHEPETHLIPIALDAALGRREAVSVFGNDYPTPDGTAIRDYIHVCDLAAAHLKALDRLLDGGDSIALNLGTGRGHSVAEVLAAADRVTGREIERRAAPRREGDPPRLVADPTLAQRALGWRAERAALEVIVADAWRWHLKRFGGDRRQP
jgi:UDP-glucose-4-epimerase GalE